jgi:hypothetical protein
LKTLLVLILLSGGLWAQSSPAPDAPTPQQKHKRGFFSSPAMSYSQDAPPLCAGQKFELFVANTVNPFQILSAAASAGFSQAIDSNHLYGQGAEGYGKRFGAAYADGASREFFGTFLVSSILKTDPRYFRKARGRFASRTTYAISRIFVTRSDSRQPAPNVALWTGAMASGAIGNAYYPENERSVGQTFSRAGIDVGTQAGFNVLREFWPDIRRQLFRRDQR